MVKDSNDPKTLWKCLHSLNPKVKNTPFELATEDNNTTKSKKCIADTFNNFFTSCAEKLREQGNYTPVNKADFSNLSKFVKNKLHKHENFSIPPVNMNELFNELAKLDINKASGMNEQNVDEIEIPGPPEIKEFTDNILTSPILIFDLETTGLQRTSDIIQIAAFSQNNKFSSYIMPNRAISNGASEVTKISVIGSQMYYNLQAVPSKLQNEAFTDFNDFVKSFLVKPLLVGHNIKCYDCHVLYNSLRFHNMWNDFASNISGFLDTLELFKLLYPKRPSYSQTALVHELLANYPKEFSLQQDNLQSFTDATFSKAISRTLALKAARSNLRLEHFNIAVNGLDGLKSVLSKLTYEGIVRVTTNKKAIIKIFDFLTRES
ncbi:Hypothetical predicted protein [Mytilus galloprovincialis]|uniref:Exonuclease domain-containing protein n=1 Tax=Mytilus galloprovincialis TaxID=29158 RepID=A0A8B6EB78_MYTGA|nr:Hypothetical predicted protein [Mytilus galloprovincialis]